MKYIITWNEHNPIFTHSYNFFLSLILNHENTVVREDSCLFIKKIAKIIFKCSSTNVSYKLLK